MDSRGRWSAAAALVIVLALVGALIAFNSNEPDTEQDSPPSAVESPQENGATDSAEQPGAEDDEAAAVESPLAATPVSAPARRRALAVSDTPSAPDSGDTGDTDDESDNGADDEFQRYLEETRAVVEADPSSLQAIAGEIVAALGAGDADALGDRVASDEGSQSEFVTYLADRYPAIVTSAPSGTVNIFTTGEATIYMAYAVVTWEDAGLTSEHTIPIPMRFVDGRWYLTSVEHWADSLEFVQSIQL
ncbi:MAG TPA: hypothetical protein DCP20_06085 [Coriobacteriia bacterium]|nr:hypothetical protein [Coriobacteriia bacterium]